MGILAEVSPTNKTIFVPTDKWSQLERWGGCGRGWEAEVGVMGDEHLTADASTENKRGKIVNEVRTFGGKKPKLDEFICHHVLK